MWLLKETDIKNNSHNIQNQIFILSVNVKIRRKQLTFNLINSIIVIIIILLKGGLLMNKDRKKVKGFTLVELIVVMLILAILAGMFIPSLVGYIEKANESELQVETRQLYQAAQVIATENYKNGGFSCSSLDLSAASGSDDKKIKEFAKLSEIDTGVVTIDCDDSGKITQIVYSNGGKSCTLNVASRSGFDIEAIEES